MTTVPFDPRRFRSTATYYARYRVPYTDALIAAVAARVGLRPGDRVLDLGCGPGVLGLMFARLGFSVTAMDPEPEMLAAARSAADSAGLEMVFQAGSSYDLPGTLGRFRLVTMGRSFHWMDRPATLTALDAMLDVGGAVTLFHDRKVWAEPAWTELLDQLSKKYSPERSEGRRVRGSRESPPHDVVLLDSAFSAVETRGEVFAGGLTADDIVGRAFSMSVTSPDALGAGRDAFEAELRAGLAALVPDGHFSEISEAVATIAFRPGEAAPAFPAGFGST